MILDVLIGAVINLGIFLCLLYLGHTYVFKPIATKKGWL